MFKSRKGGQTDGLTLITKDVHIKGELDGKGCLRVDGELEGKITIEGDVIIGEGGKVTATVEAANLTVAGTLKGKAIVTNRLHIGPAGRVEGDVQAARLAVEEGGVLLGHCSAAADSPHLSEIAAKARLKKSS
ncbi:MAG: polymer-forming cytoskeletal protein [Thermoanaerobacterales bacterium]|nr:polymer-forming cytoskeletal protein [Thermoanaerobacterales bacterium]